MTGRTPKRKFFMAKKAFRIIPPGSGKAAHQELLKNHKELMKRKTEFIKGLYAREGAKGLMKFYADTRIKATALLAKSLIALEKTYGIKLEGNESWTKLTKMEIPKLSRQQMLDALEFIRGIDKRIDATSDFLIDADMLIAKRFHETKNPEERKQVEEAIKSFHEHPPLAHVFLGPLTSKIFQELKKI